MAKTKIIVLQMKEIIYTAIFVGLGILLILLLVFMFLPDKGDVSESAAYKPGVYTTQVSLNDTTLNLELVVDATQVKSLKLVNLQDSIATMYPLVKPALAEIESQLVKGTKIDNVTISESSKYTQTLLLNAIETTLNKAKADQ